MHIVSLLNNINGLGLIVENNIIVMVPKTPYNGEHFFQRVDKQFVIEGFVGPDIVNPINNIHITIARRRAMHINGGPDINNQITTSK